MDTKKASQGITGKSHVGTTGISEVFAELDSNKFAITQEDVFTGKDLSLEIRDAETALKLAQMLTTWATLKQNNAI